MIVMMRCVGDWFHSIPFDDSMQPTGGKCEENITCLPSKARQDFAASRQYSSHTFCARTPPLTLDRGGGEGCTGFSAVGLRMGGRTYCDFFLELEWEFEWVVRWEGERFGCAEGLR